MHNLKLSLFSFPTAGRHIKLPSSLKLWRTGWRTWQAKRGNLGLFVFLVLSITLHASEVIITAEHSGRFGDQLSLLIDALWLSHKTGIPLHLRMFKNVTGLTAYTCLPHLRKKALKGHKKLRIKNAVRFLKQRGSRALNAKIKTAYVLPYSGPSANRIALYRADTDFLQQVRGMMSPRNSIPLIKPPADKNILSVAVHIRKGIAKTDEANVRKAGAYKICGNGNVLLPFGSNGGKFLPDSFYLQQIRLLAHKYPEKQLYVFIFTDHECPATVRDAYRMQLCDCTNVRIESRTTASQKQDGILADFFSLFLFDCLIRSQSSFAMMAELLGDYQEVIAPRIVRPRGSRHSVLVGATRVR